MQDNYCVLVDPNNPNAQPSPIPSSVPQQSQQAAQSSQPNTHRPTTAAAASSTPNNNNNNNNNNNYGAHSNIVVRELEYVGKAAPHVGMFKAGNKDKHWLFHRAEGSPPSPQQPPHGYGGFNTPPVPATARVEGLDGHGRKRSAHTHVNYPNDPNNPINPAVGNQNHDVRGLIFGGGYENPNYGSNNKEDVYANAGVGRMRPKSSSAIRSSRY
jgi:hypothetical protein